MNPLQAETWTKMDKAIVEQRVRNMVRDHARLKMDVETLECSADLYMVGMTSHASVALMLALENEFELEFPDSLLNRRVFESIDTIAIAIMSVQQREP
jgi:acyl carrier protein